MIEPGKNNGSETLLLSILVGASARLFAFKPVPHVRDELIKNVKLNRCEAIVSVERHVLTEKSGTATVFLAARAEPDQKM